MTAFDGSPGDVPVPFGEGLSPAEEVSPGVAPGAPAVEVRHERLDPSFVTAERVGSWIFFLFVLFGMGTGLTLTWFFGDLEPRLFALLAGGAGALLVLLFFNAQFWPKIDYRHRSWSLDGESVVVKRGVFWRHVISVPRSRIQHTDVSRGPVERRLGLATLIIHTAGNHDFEIRLPGLTEEKALALRDELLAGQSDED